MKILKLIILSALLSNCASYCKKEFKNELIAIDKSNLSNLNGTFESRPFRYFGKQSDWTKKDSLKTRKLLGIYEKLQNKSGQYDQPEVLDYEYVKMEFKSNEKLIYELISKDSILKTDTINFKIKNGMIKLKNAFYKCEGIPFLFGGCRNGRVRIGLSDKNNLIINKSYDQYGALLIVIGAGVNSNSTYEYQKIE